jgi:para-aminobenzoate synthetase/4-amino-4-deoxychorismate lyase
LKFEPYVRFDAPSGGRSFRFSGVREIVEAWHPEEVLVALQRVEGAAAEGLHAAGYVAYEAASAWDPALVTHPPTPGLPLLWFGLFAERSPVGSTPQAGGYELGGWTPSIDANHYQGQIGQIRDWIRAGDSYQVNHTFRLRAPFQGDDLALYADLCRAQQAAYCAYLQIGPWSVLSASPELFFRWDGMVLELRPMKGTRPRGRWPAEDQALAEQLRVSAKDRAENLMIVDMLRNDAGRIADWGSVEVPELYAVERYPTVHQMTSTVRARTRTGTTLCDVFRALFPCGSVTGAPKVRTMQIIREIESEPRGVYTGAIGFVSPGETVFSVAIRTLVLNRENGQVELGVGSGITYDSDPQDEYRECLAKAAFTRGRPYAFQLLETLRYTPGAGFSLLDEHLARIVASADYFGFPCDPEQLRRALDSGVADCTTGPCKVRLLLDRKGMIQAEAQLLAICPEPLRVRIADSPVDSSDVFLYHKTTQREVYESRAAACPECDDVLLTNERSELTEFTVGNLVVVLDRSAWTPPLHAGLLPGVLRGDLLRRGELRERVLRPEDLQQADGVYRINSLRGWQRVFAPIRMT